MCIRDRNYVGFFTTLNRTSTIRVLPAGTQQNGGEQYASVIAAQMCIRDSRISFTFTAPLWAAGHNGARPKQTCMQQENCSPGAVRRTSGFSENSPYGSAGSNRPCHGSTHTNGMCSGTDHRTTTGCLLYTSRCV